MLEHNSKKRVTIKIMGDEYILRGSSSQEHLERVAEYVDGVMEKLSKNNPQMSKHRLAVLGSINLADEVLRLKDELNKRGCLQQLQIEQDRVNKEGTENTGSEGSDND